MTDIRITLALSLINHHEGLVCDEDWPLLRDIRDALRGKSIDEIRASRGSASEPGIRRSARENGCTTEAPRTAVTVRGCPPPAATGDERYAS